MSKGMGRVAEVKTKVLGIEKTMSIPLNQVFLSVQVKPNNLVTMSLDEMISMYEKNFFDLTRRLETLENKWV